MKEKYKLRKKWINKITGLSEQIDDVFTSYKKETTLLISKFLILICTIVWLIGMIFIGKWYNIALGVVLVLTSFVSYLTHIGKWRMVKAMAQIKMMREVQ